MAAPALLVGPPKFAFGDPNNVIALVDTRHDFKGFSQDIVSKPRNAEGEDYVQHFHNNLQRISLGLEEEYSRRLTSRCNFASNEVMTIGPEQDFLHYIVANFCNNNQGWQRYDVNLTDYASYDIYHSAIANYIRYGNEIPDPVPPNNPIPLVVDTHRTLSHNSRPYFIICKNKESVADPSRTSMQTFDNNTFEEFGTEQRTHEINTIIHTLSGELNSPTVTYTFPPSGYSETLQFNKSGGHKPNEINICKTRIQSRIKELHTAAPGAPPAPPLTTLATVLNLDIHYCYNYSNIQYKGLLGPQHNKDRIAFSYIAKRAGDQLQVLSCRQNITYKQVGTTNNYSIHNCVFWTIDAIAACYAILNGITTVIQHPNKSVTIYRRNDYIPNIVQIPPAPMPLVVGGKNKKYKKKYYGGAACTTDLLNAFLNDNNYENEHDCWYYAMQKLCDIQDDLYEPWTLLNFLVYYFCINFPNSEYTNTLMLLLQNPNFTLSNDNCFNLNPGLTDLQNIASINGVSINNIPTGNRMLILINGSYSFSVIKDPGGLKFYINFIPYSNIIPISNLIPITDDQFKYYYYITLNSNEAVNIIGGGKRLTFYDNWNELKSAFDIKKANKLFIEFIQLLSLCETLHFQNIDSADNFYVYDPKSQVYIGGHTQIEFLAFFNSMINMYNNSKNNSKNFEAFLKMFIHFPTLLTKTQYNTINRDIYDYISCWFNYQVNTDTTINTKNDINNIFNTIITETENKCTEIYRKLSKDNHETSQYLHSIFPHGYFTIKFNEITNKPSNTRVLKINRNLVNTRKRKRNNGSNGSKVTNRVNNYNRISGGKHTRKRVK